MKVFLADRVYVATNTVGTGAIALGEPLKGYQTPLQAGVPGGADVRYVIEEGFAWELGWGVYDGTAQTVTRNLVQSSTGALLELTGGAKVFFTAAGEDIVQPDDLAEVDAKFDDYLPLAGGTMTGVLELDGGPGDYLLPLRLLKGANIWGIGADDLTNLAVVKGINTVAQFEDIGSTASGAVTVMTRQKGDARYLRLSGGTMTGAITLPGAPTDDLHAATKKYVDDGIDAIPPGATVSETPPATPEDGQFWYSTVEPVGLFMWYVDADSGQWVQVSGTAALPFATDADALAGTSADRVMSPALVQARQGSIYKALTGLSSVLFPGIPAEATEIDLAVNGLTYAAGTPRVFFAFDGVTSGYYHTRALIANNTAPLTFGADNDATVTLDSNTAAGSLNGVIKLRRHSGNWWTVSGTMRRSTSTMLTYAGLINFNAMVLSGMSLNITTSFSSGGASVDWRV